MANTGTIWHTDPNNPNGPNSFPNDICIPGVAAGENVGSWSGASEDSELQSIHNLMMNGQGEQHDPQTCQQYVNHACNIVSTKYGSVGIGIVLVGDTVYLTEDFIG